MYRLTILFSLLLQLSGLHHLSAQHVLNSADIIPFPQHLQLENGMFRLTKKTLHYTIDTKKTLNNAEAFIKDKLFEGKVKKERSNAKQADLQLRLKNGLSKEGYELQIKTDGITIEASGDEGFFYGLQTLQQLYQLSGRINEITLPLLSVRDAPAYSWRGVELDVARHFFSKAYLYRFIDLLASYKFNKLHLHLTDDQGWRVEIKQYPKLTEEGAWRIYNNQDSACMKYAEENPDFNLPQEHIRVRNGKTEYGGFYTQQDIRDIVAYAQKRNVEIIPEIDMPGHMMIATKAYPELLLDSLPAGWGKQFSVPISPWKESSYKFIENVLSEIITLFPSSYIHIGADEVEKDSWSKSTAAQAFMQEKGITDLHELQSYFVKRVNQYIRSQNKTAIGWDEILEGPSDTTMLVMYWRGWEKEAPLKAVNRGHRLVMTPTNPLYFDYLPNSSTLDAVYNMAVVPADIPNNKRKLVQGAQANIWTEMIPSRERLEFMILPRLTALAERTWTDKSLYMSYQDRVISHYALWDKQGFRYRMPDLTGFADSQILVDDKSTLKVNNELLSSQIHYTTDGSIPNRNSAVLSDSLIIEKPGRIRFATISNSGAKSELYQVDIKPGEWKNAALISVDSLKSGLSVDFYPGVFRNTTKITGSPVRKTIIKNIHLADTIKIPAFGAKIQGYIHIREKGIYNFYFTCDDGGVLKIDNDIVVDNDGQHAPIMKSGQIALEAGYHPIHIDFIEAGGGFTLKLLYGKEHESAKIISDDQLFHRNQIK